VAADVLQLLEVLVGRLRRLAQHEPVVAPAREVPTLAVGLCAAGTSIAKGTCSRATHDRMRGSSTAPRLSELDTKA